MSEHEQLCEHVLHWMDPSVKCPKFERGPHGILVSAPVLVATRFGLDIAQWVKIGAITPFWVGLSSQYNSSNGMVTAWANINAPTTEDAK